MPSNITGKIVVLAGGVGGAKIVNGLAQVMPLENISVIVNTADDFEYLGLSICPDLDTIMYTLAGINNTETGWGRADETCRVMDEIAELNGPTWFRLGDKDIAVHLLRTQWKRQGYDLFWITNELCRLLSVNVHLMPMTTQQVRTIIHTRRKILDFQTYFVRQKCEPVVQKVEFDGISETIPPLGVVKAIRFADLIFFAPSNPFLSIDPILAVPTMKRLLQAAHVPKVAVSPIIGGKAIKGPACKIMQEFGLEVSPFTVANHFRDILTHFVLDVVDNRHNLRIYNLGLKTLVTNTLMKSVDDQARLAYEILKFVF